MVFATCTHATCSCSVPFAKLDLEAPAHSASQLPPLSDCTQVFAYCKIVVGAQQCMLLGDMRLHLPLPGVCSTRVQHMALYAAIIVQGSALPCHTSETLMSFGLCIRQLLRAVRHRQLCTECHLRNLELRQAGLQLVASCMAACWMHCICTQWACMLLAVIKCFVRNQTKKHSGICSTCGYLDPQGNTLCSWALWGLSWTSLGLHKLTWLYVPAPLPVGQ